jgi:hypothetical protein
VSTLCTALDHDIDEDGRPMTSGCRLEANHEGNHFRASRCPCGDLIIGNAWAVVAGIHMHVRCAANKLEDDFARACVD